MANFSFGQTHTLQEIAVVDSSTVYLNLGTRTIFTGSDNNLHLFYVSRASTDTVFHVSSADGGYTWGTKEVVALNPQGGMGNQFHISSLSATEDATGKIHLVYTYRGTPYYNASSSYPPSHIGFASNETGSWEYSANVLNDSALLYSEMQNVPTNYIYDNYIYPRNGELFFSGYDYAWFSNIYHFVYAKRDTTNTWGTLDSVAAINRGAIDKYSMGPARIFGDGASTLYGLWYDKWTGDLKVMESPSSFSNWSSPTTIGTLPNAMDGIQNSHNLAVVSGATARASMTRWLTGWSNTTLVNMVNSGSGWSMDTTSLPGNYYYPNISTKGDTVFTTLLNGTYDAFTIIGQYTGGWTSPITVTLPDTLQYIFLNAEEGVAGPLVYIKRNNATGKYWLCVGTIDRLLTNRRSDLGTSIKAFPNPTTGELHLRLQGIDAEIENIKILDLQGRTRQTIEINDDLTIQLRELGLAPGVYFVQVNTNQGSHSTKVILQ